MIHRTHSPIPRRLVVIWILTAPALPLLFTAQLRPGSVAGSVAWAATTPTEPLIDPQRDTRIEELLRRGRIGRTERTHLGVTDPLRVWVEDQGETISGCFKYVDLQTKGITRTRSGKTELNFTDRHIYDQAAYKLDRELGMNRIPVAVSRKVRGLQGTLVHWLDDVVDETSRLEQSLSPEVRAKIHQQKSTMLVFDALIDNIDRNAGNLLYTRSDWDLYLIDHTRAFRTETKLREKFLARSVKLHRPFYEKLRELDETRLRKILKGLLSRTQIRALLVRRDLIVEKVETERRLRGDDDVFMQ